MDGWMACIGCRSAARLYCFVCCAASDTKCRKQKLESEALEASNDSLSSFCVRVFLFSEKSALLMLVSADAPNRAISFHDSHSLSKCTKPLRCRCHHGVSQCLIVYITL